MGGRLLACFFCLDGAGVGLSTFQSQYISSSEVTRNESFYFALQLAMVWSSFISC